MANQTRIVLTGGPSAGKTTLLELLAKQFGPSLGIAPEAASILFRGGWRRPETFDERLHTQRSIYALQKELEQGALDSTGAMSVLCDRGALDGAAYWEGGVKEFCFAMGTTLERELERYAIVLHLETAPENAGYTNTAVRTETPEQARALDLRIGEIWGTHPNYVFVGNEGRSFVEKLSVAMALLRPYLPEAATAEARFRFATAGDLLTF